MHLLLCSVRNRPALVQMQQCLTDILEVPTIYIMGLCLLKLIDDGVGTAGGSRAAEG